MYREQKYKEFTLDEYMKHEGVTLDQMKEKDFFKERPNHQLLQCLEGMVYGVMIRDDNNNS